MEHLYAFGIVCIEYVQYWFQDYEGYLETVNHISNPDKITSVLLPFVAAIDSVFAAQLLLCSAFCNWLNAVMKWWFLEDRPYWWVHETDFYSTLELPNIRQYPQSCETGPGSPSGHSQSASALLILLACWLEHIINDRNLNPTFWKYLTFPLGVAALVSVLIARLFVAAHFPHQVLLGALLGAFIAPALCIYISDPYIWQYGIKPRQWYLNAAALCAVVSIVTRFGLELIGWDTGWSIDLALRYCHKPEYIRFTTMPLFWLVQSTGYLFGWALSISPEVAQYRHYTQRRSLLIAGLATYLIANTVKLVNKIFQDSEKVYPCSWCYYIVYFMLCIVKSFAFLRVVPMLARSPYEGFSLGLDNPVLGQEKVKIG